MKNFIKFRKSIMLFMKIILIFAMLFSFLTVWQIFYSFALFSRISNFLIVVSYLVGIVTFNRLYGGFRIGINRLHEIVYSQILAILFTNLIVYFELCLLNRRLVAVGPMLLAAALQFSIAFCGSFCANKTYFRLYPPRKIIAVFDDEASGGSLIRKMSKIPERFELSRGVSLLRYSIDEVKQLIDNYDGVIICDIDKNVKHEILRYCYSRMKRVYVLPSSSDIILGSSYHIQITDTPVLMCRNRGLTAEQRMLKRLFDITVSALGIVITSPIMLIVAVAIKICDGGPVLFKQNRVTQNGRIFNMLKFRSMIVDADKQGAKGATDNDDRITPVGRVIRPLRIDELPQLFNILFGSMSFVGPRPERIENVYEYTKAFPDFDLRHRVKAGLTGFAQIYGKYNTTPADKLKMDLMYIERYSILFDLKLLLMTIKILFMRESTEGFKESQNIVLPRSKSVTEVTESKENENE